MNLDPRIRRQSGARLSRARLAPLGASPGAGVVHALPASECGLARTADIVGLPRRRSARQCGPCLNGLPRLAHLLDEIAYGPIDDGLLHDTHRMLDLVEGRGSCRHPDGTARLIRSALDVFADDIACHRRATATPWSPPLPSPHSRCETDEATPNRAPACTSTGPDATAEACAPNCYRGCSPATTGDTRCPATRRANRAYRASALSAARRGRAVSPTRPVDDRRHSGRRAPASRRARHDR